jgi:hypothetical protein
MRRKRFTFFSTASVLFLLAVCFFFARAGTTTDVFAFPLGGQRQVIVTSHVRRYVEFTLVQQWPDARIGWWSGQGWRNVGPFKGWLIHREYAYGQLWPVRVVEGQMLVPLASPNGPALYDGAYDRAVSRGLPHRAAALLSVDDRGRTGGPVPYPYVLLCSPRAA